VISKHGKDSGRTAADKQAEFERLFQGDIAEHLRLGLHHVLERFARGLARRQQHLERHAHEDAAEVPEVLPCFGPGGRIGF
jgi:hypothetical protein